MVTTCDIAAPFMRQLGELTPELYDREVPDWEVGLLKKAIRFYRKRLAWHSQDNDSAYDEMSAMGAPMEDFAEDGFFQSDRQALADVRKLYPEIAERYFVGFSPMYGKPAPNGMGNYDRYGGL